MRKKEFKEQKRARQHFENLGEENKRVVRKMVTNFYDYIDRDEVSAFDIGEGLAILESGQWGMPIVGEITSTDLRWLLQDIHFLQDNCGYPATVVNAIRRDYTTLTSCLKFYFLYRDWPDLAKRVPPVSRRVMLANKNSKVSLPLVFRSFWETSFKFFLMLSFENCASS
jgi:hypothetical protein